jgi:hypothetical protein
MKKSTRKFALRSETIRALTQMDLVLVAGGADDRVVGTQDAGTGCPLQAAAAAEPAK